MFPVAISVGTYDRLLKLPYIYYGPELPGIRFRGRPLAEWTVLVIALPILWPLTDLAIWIVDASHFAGRSFEGVLWAVAHIGATWIAASAIAGYFYRNLINTDRDIGWILQTARNETLRVAAAYGPLDPLTLAAGAPIAAAATWAASTTNLPLPVDLAVAAALGWPAGCALVAAVQAPARAQRLATERALRRGPTATLTLTGSPDAEAA